MSESKTIPVHYLLPILRELGIKIKPLFAFLPTDQKNAPGDSSEAVLWWNSLTEEDKIAYTAQFEALADPASINRIITMQYFDQVYLMNLYSGKKTAPGTVYSISLSTDGKGYSFKGSNQRIAYINSIMAFLGTGDLNNNVENAAILLKKDAFITLACIIDLIQKGTFSHTPGQSILTDTFSLVELEKYHSDSLNSKDFQRLLPLVTISFPYLPETYKKMDWNASLKQLQDLDFITHLKNDTHFTLTAPGKEFCFSMAQSVKRLALNSIQESDTGTIFLNNCLCIRTWNRIWAIIPDSSSEILSLTIIDPITLFKLLDELIIPDRALNRQQASGLTTTYPEERTSSAENCPSCHAPLPPNAKFCRNCGKPVSPTVKGEMRT